MLSEVHSRLITEVGRDTPMGRLMREYWIPVMRSSRLEPGGAPLRLTILGEKLVAYRLETGEAGVLDEACPHRGASMALARNEKCGLRCIYHGWKIAPSGELIEAPTHPPSFPLQRIKTRAHPVREGQGIVWTWLGEGDAPAFRQLSFTGLPDDHVIAATMVVNCNWLSPLETLWDIFHAQVLHNQTNRASSRGNVYFSKTGLRTDTGLQYDYPEMLTRRTEYGFTHTNRDAAKDTSFHFILPFIEHHTISPDPMEDKGVHMSVPIDDEHTLIWQVFYNRFAPLKSDGFGIKNLGGLHDLDNLYNNLENPGPRTPENRWGWGQDRDAMKNGKSFAGFVEKGQLMNTLAEDFCVLESQGRVDRSVELLAPVDRAVVEGRRTLLDAVESHQRGEPPLGRDLDLTQVEAVFVVNPVAA